MPPFFDYFFHLIRQGFEFRYGVFSVFEHKDYLLFSLYLLYNRQRISQWKKLIIFIVEINHKKVYSGYSIFTEISVEY